MKASLKIATITLLAISEVSSVKINGFVVNPISNETEFIQLSSSLNLSKNDTADPNVPSSLKNNSLFNEISGFKITGGLIG